MVCRLSDAAPLREVIETFCKRIDRCPILMVMLPAAGYLRTVPEQNELPHPAAGVWLQTNSENHRKSKRSTEQPYNMGNLTGRKQLRGERHQHQTQSRILTRSLALCRRARLTATRFALSGSFKALLFLPHSDTNTLARRNFISASDHYARASINPPPLYTPPVHPQWINDLGGAVMGARFGTIMRSAVI